MKDLTIGDVGRALEEAFHTDDTVRVAGDTTRVDFSHAARVDFESAPAVRLPTPTAKEAVGAMEEREYRQFAELLGIEDDEPLVRMVTVSVEQHQEWKAQRAMLDDLMRQRPENISEAEQAEYEQFIALIGPV